MKAKATCLPFLLSITPAVFANKLRGYNPHHHHEIKSNQTIDLSTPTTIELFRDAHPAPGLGHPVKFKPLLSHPKAADKLSIAIGRPFSLKQTRALVSSFSDWEDYPLSKDGCRGYDVGLMLSFSGDDHNNEVNAMYEEIQALNAKTNGWGGCISSVDMCYASIPAGEDTYGDYHSKEGGDVNWVNGPNRQFERFFRCIESKNKYDVWFLMEPDVRPLQNFWLDNMYDEMMMASPFALLGSKYNGKAWNGFSDRISLDLLHHLNGNAVYNLSDPLLLNVLNELESEADTVFNAIPFDLRISQILLEAKSGTASPFVFDTEHHQVELPSKTDVFTSWWSEHVESRLDYEPVKVSNILSNQASMLYTPDDLEMYSVVHGNKENEFLPWDSAKHGEVTLVIKTFSESFDSHALLNIMNADSHPFSNIVVMLTGKAHSPATQACQNDIKSANVGTPVVTQLRSHDTNRLDICEAQVSTQWFMIVGDKYSIAEDMELLVTPDGSNRPLQGGVDSNSEHCLDYKVCLDTMVHAHQVYPELDFYFLSGDVLFNTEMRNKFCNYLTSPEYEKDSPLTPFRHGLAASDTVISTQYFAFLYKRNTVHSTYVIKDQAKLGIRRKFNKRTAVTAFENNVEDAYSNDDSVAIPMYWHIPKSGGTAAKRILNTCLSLVVVSGDGARIDQDGSDSLHIVTKGVHRYLNVDVTNENGINKAMALDPLGSGLADVVVTPTIDLVVNNLLSTSRGVRARMFGVFRHPIDRAASLFHYLQKADWEPTFDPGLSNMTIAEWAMSGKAENNWMVRTLTQDMDSHDLSEGHLELAKDIIEKKFVIGLTSEMKLSWELFKNYFGWPDTRNSYGCMTTMLAEKSNANEHDKILKGSTEWEALKAINKYDIALYEYIVKLFWERQTDEQKIDSTEDELQMVSELAYERRIQEYPGSKTSKSKTSKSKAGKMSKTNIMEVTVEDEIITQLEEEEEKSDVWNYYKNWFYEKIVPLLTSLFKDESNNSIGGSNGDDYGSDELV